MYILKYQVYIYILYLCGFFLRKNTSDELAAINMTYNIQINVSCDSLRIHSRMLS